MTLKCVADGNPPPTSYNFHIKVNRAHLALFILNSLLMRSCFSGLCGLLHNLLSFIYSASISTGKRVEVVVHMSIFYLVIYLSPVATFLLGLQGRDTP